MNLRIIMLSQNNQARGGGGNTVSLLIANTKKLENYSNTVRESRSVDYVGQGWGMD